MKSTRKWLLGGVFGLVILSGCGERETAKKELVIDTTSLTEEPLFVDWQQDEVAMQFLVRKDAQGTASLSFNTCQSCNGSPYAYFEYIPEEQVFQCQNCGLTFPLESMDHVLNEQGCNPIPVSEYEVGESTITVSEKVLSEGAKLFENWKKFEG